MTLKTLIKKGIGSLGYELRHRAAVRSGEFDGEAAAREAIDVVRDHTMLSYEPMVTLYQQVRHCDTHRIPGAFVECGVWKGGSVGLMALANLRHSTTRRHLHLFDAFDDICQPDPAVDGERAMQEVEELAGVSREGLDGSLKPLTGIYDSLGGHGTVEAARALLEESIGYDTSHLHFHKGWFQQTVPAASETIGDIAILRLDGDWYASTRVCLQHLYDRVVPGGFVIFDDYGAYDGCRRAVDEFAVERGLKHFLSHVNVDCRYWRKD